MDVNANASITRIPPELLGEIFGHCTAFCPDAPVVLSAVCTSFRDVVQRTPPVWTRLRISVRQSPNERGRNDAREKEASKAALWFAMARNCPLSLYVVLNGVEAEPQLATGDDHNAYFSRIPCINVIQANTPQIQALSIRTSSEDVAHKFLHFLYPPSLHCSSLRRLNINVFPDAPLTPSLSRPHVAAPPPHILPLPALSNLRSLKLTNHSFPSPVSFSTLESLTIVRPLRATPINASDILRCLHANPSLVDIHIDCRISEPDDIATRPIHKTATTSSDDDANKDLAVSALPRIFSLPFVTHLSLRGNHLPLILNALVLPSLTALTLDDLDGKNPAHHLGATLRGLLIRSALATSHGRINITSLSLTNACMFTHVVDHHAHGDHGDRGWDGDGDEIPVWQWCFSRMESLEVLSAENTDGDEHMGLLHLLADASSHMPSLEEDIAAGTGAAEGETADRSISNASGNANSPTHPLNTTSTPTPRHFICPNLKTLKLSSPYPYPPIPSSSIQNLKSARPSVQIELLTPNSPAHGVNGVTSININPNSLSYQPNALASRLFPDRFLPLLPLADPTSASDLSGGGKPTQSQSPSQRSPSDLAFTSGMGFGSTFDRRRKMVRSQTDKGSETHPANTFKARRIGLSSPNNRTCTEPVVMSLLPGDENLW
ncbi:hypothetical protein CCMSSC00406_0007053 [Pleurotus cornucopiae]|uniref:Uncharacterized protein n=1 Tax=Pleurotus cornucopiae TaxID=5321 RepID=A0ACB7J3Q6_PLECO|nr:hypothetical protein CCMSSC00406_0007053 [Pleurotus cornucopiae]